MEQSITKDIKISFMIIVQVTPTMMVRWWKTNWPIMDFTPYQLSVLHKVKLHLKSKKLGLFVAITVNLDCELCEDSFPECVYMRVPIHSKKQSGCKAFKKSVV